MRRDHYAEYTTKAEAQLAEACDELDLLSKTFGKMKAEAASLAKSTDARLLKAESTVGLNSTKIEIMHKVNEAKGQLNGDMLQRLKDLEDNKEDKSGVADLRARFAVFSQLETVHALENTFMPRIIGFTKLVDKLEDSHA